MSAAPVGATPLQLKATRWNPTYRLFDPFASPEDVSEFKEINKKIRVIGATAPRTGTSSLKVALDILGFGPVDHMQSYLRDSHRCREVIRAFQVCEFDGGEYDWDSLFAGYGATVDDPSACVVNHLIKAYPDAKIICTVREKRKWWKSMDDTVGNIAWKFPGGTAWKWINFWFPKVWWQTQMSVMTARTAIHQGRLPWGEGPDALDAYIKWVQSLNIPKEKILYYSVEQGWGPLCEFLEVPVPNIDFPRVNDSSSFRRGIQLNYMMGATAWSLFFGTVGTGAYYLYRSREAIVRQIEALL